MDYVALLIFLGLYYLRPQEWYPFFNALRPIELLSFMAVWAMFKSNKLKPRDLVRTPLDWLVLCYFIWTLLAGGQFFHILGGIEAVLLFYFVAVRSLDSVPRQKSFLGWWCLFMFVIAALAIASAYGFDPLGSYDITQGPMKGRLILNLSIFNNPNGLGHSIVPVVPLLYYLLFWRRVFMRAGLVLLAVPLYCVYLTQSKGAFLCGFATVLATLTFGRSKAIQILIVVVAIGLGYGALYTLPRMNELKNAKGDPAIQGRIAAFSYGMQAMETHFFGLGLGNFTAMFTRYGPTERIRHIKIIPAHSIMRNEGAIEQVGVKRIVSFENLHFPKATHSAYNQNGAELGYVGLFLFVSILYCCIRTLLLVKSQDDDEERIRRALFASVVAYAISSWMVDFCYRPTFFLMVAAVSAFHRHLLKKQAGAGEPVVETPLIVQRPWLRRLPPIQISGNPLPGLAGSVPVGSAARLASDATSTASPMPIRLPGAGSARVLGWHKPETSLQDKLLQKFIWTRLGIADYLIMLVLTYASILYWRHLIKIM
jgi:hypothetical protein